MAESLQDVLYSNTHIAMRYEIVYSRIKRAFLLRVINTQTGNEIREEIMQELDEAKPYIEIIRTAPKVV